jgi:metal-responsive CopG/Arc/MetJ family transcriptional regulator
MKRTRVPVTVSLPSNLAENFERLAKAEAKNKSQLFSRLRKNSCVLSCPGVDR